MIKDNLDTIRAMKYENSREYEPAEGEEDKKTVLTLEKEKKEVNKQ